MDATDFAALCGFDPAGKTRPQLERALERCGRVSSFAAAKKYAVLAALDSLGDDGPAPSEANRARTRESQRQSRKAARTADQLTEMPGIQSALERGAISPEHADSAAEAAARVSPEAADEALTRLATQLPADRFAKEARDWAGHHEARDEAETRLERARRERCGRVWRKNNGRVAVHGEFDAVAGNPALAAFEAEMDRLFRADGGRDADPSTARTYAQRGADALVGLLTAHTSASSTAARPTAAGSAAGGATAAGDVTAGSRSGRPKQPHPRYTTHLRVDLDRCTSDEPEGAAAFIDGTPIPQSALEQIACESAFVGAVYSADGAILWQGRSVRLATDDQWHALIDRDGGCRHCGADPSRCQAHHIVSWAPPANGPSDIDHLVLVCDHGHTLIHRHGWMVTIDDHGEYHINPP